MDAQIKERPILFSGPMVRAILAGRKTVTRRIVNLKQFGPSNTQGYDWHFRDKLFQWNDYRNNEIASVCPHGQPGDRLWVRETFAIDADTNFFFRADGGADPWTPMQWKPSIFMPRAVSRITLEITDVRVERLKQISPTEIQREGFDIDNRTIAEDGVCLIEQFARLWEKLNGKASWELNPWVWVIEFKWV